MLDDDGLPVPTFTPMVEVGNQFVDLCAPTPKCGVLVSRNPLPQQCAVVWRDISASFEEVSQCTRRLFQRKKRRKSTWNDTTYVAFSPGSYK